jgi:hypothetical protein
MMRKTTRKFLLRKETLRELSGQALTHVIGGQETAVAVPYSGAKVCLTAVAYPQTGDKQCLT